MPRCSAAGLDFRIIPAGFNAPLEFLTGFTVSLLYFFDQLIDQVYRIFKLGEGPAYLRFLVAITSPYGLWQCKSIFMGGT